MPGGRFRRQSKKGIVAFVALSVVLHIGFWNFQSISKAYISPSTCSSLCSNLGRRTNLARNVIGNQRVDIAGDADSALNVMTAMDVEELARHVVRALVLGPNSYPILRRLDGIDRYPGGDILQPGDWGEQPLSPAKWSSSNEAMEYFFKLACVGMCSRAVYIMMELAGGIERLTFRGRAISNLKIAHGFVTHEYELLRLADDFNNVTWQYGAGVISNEGRVHSWLCADVDGESPIALDLTAAQYGIFTRTDDIFLTVVPRADKRYRECYTTSTEEAAVEFVRWSACYDLQETEAAHVCTIVQQLQRELGVRPRVDPASLLRVQRLMLDAMSKVQLGWPDWDIEERVKYFADLPEIQELAETTGRNFAAFGHLEFEQEAIEKEYLEGSKKRRADDPLVAHVAASLAVAGEVLQVGSWVMIQDFTSAPVHNGKKGEVAEVDWRWGVYKVRLSDDILLKVRAENVARTSPPSLLSCLKSGATSGAHYHKLMRARSYSS